MCKQDILNRIELCATLQKSVDKMYKAYAKKAHPVISAIVQEEEYIKTNCPHPEECIMVKQKYVEGGYLNTGYTTYTVGCMLCGNTNIGEHSKSDGRYG